LRGVRFRIAIQTRTAVAATRLNLRHAVFTHPEALFRGETIPFDIPGQKRQVGFFFSAPGFDNATRTFALSLLPFANTYKPLTGLSMRLTGNNSGFGFRFRELPSGFEPGSVLVPVPRLILFKTAQQLFSPLTPGPTPASDGTPGGLSTMTNFSSSKTTISSVARTLISCMCFVTSNRVSCLITSSIDVGTSHHPVGMASPGWLCARRFNTSTQTFTRPAKRSASWLLI
jgi:hypothetical protein